MKARLGAFAALALLFSAACTTTKAGPPPPAPPVIKTFTADKTLVRSGEAVTLTFTTADAKDVSLIDQSGDAIPVTGTVESGKATVMPTKTSFYVLRVTGAGGKDSAFLQVAVNEGLRQVFLIAVPTEVASGEPVELVWSALGGSNISVKDSTGATLSTNEESGTRSATPEKTTTWTLRADGPAGPVSATARVIVRPVIQEFSAAPPAARQGQKIRLSWRTAGADDVVVREKTFGELVATTTDVAAGTTEFTVPTEFAAATDGGTPTDGGTAVPVPVPDNFPLQFTLTARTNSPLQIVTSTIDSVVRDGPMINTFDAPGAVSENKPFTLNWTVSAFRSQLLLDGTPIYSTIPPASASASLTLPGITADTTVTLVAFDYLGLKVTSTKVVKVVKPPKVNTFTLPAQVAGAGTSANAAWTTMNATLVVLRVKNGPTQLINATPAMVTAGSGSVFPSRDTTYVLEAYNAAGDMDSMEKAITVGTPATATATPNPTSPNTNVVLDWNIASLTPTEVIGIPSDVVLATPNANTFVDLENLPGATKLFFSDRSDGTSTFTVPDGFRFPFITAMLNRFTVGVNGFVALAPTSGSTLITNVDLKGTTGLPTVPLIAPFWDNLDLGMNGEVYWAVDGSTFPRRLVIQWNKANVGGDAQSNLTFQVQLTEAGEIHFVYKTLSETNTAFGQGQSATVGIFAPGLFAGQHSFNAATLAENQDLAWFTNGLTAGMVTIKVGATGLTPGFFYKTAGGAYVYVSIPIRVFAAGSVRVSEAMPIPDPGAAMGQYVELANPSATELDLSGLQLVGTVTTTPGFTLPAGTILPAKGFLVLGQSVDAQMNNDAQVTVAYGADVPFTGGADGVRLVIPGTSPFEISKLTWTTATASTSVQLETAVGTLTCTRMLKYGPLMSTGTPGKANESCFEYTLENIPVSYFDISGPGSTVLTTGDSALGTLDLSSAPFPFFKMNATSLKASTNGFINFDTTNTDSGTTNRTAPSTTATTKGSVAIFWDDLDSNDTVPDSNVYARRMAAGADPANPGGHWIIQWHHYEHWITSPHDDLNFQAKLFDTGVIEFHYGTMTSGTTSLYANGNSSTIWVEQKSGSAALPIGINQAVIEPNTAYRFVPKP